jgi:hypothetical protein
LRSPDGESNISFSSFINNSASDSICVYFRGSQHRLSSCNIHRNSQTGTALGFVYCAGGAVVTIAKCSFKDNLCSEKFFHAATGSITLSECCYDLSTTSGVVHFGSVSAFEHTLAHLFLRQCLGQFHESESSELCGSRKSQICLIIPGFRFRFSVLVLGLCDPIQTLVGIRSPFFIFGHRQLRCS